jgi:hypothetical protein
MLPSADRGEGRPAVRRPTLGRAEVILVREVKDALDPQRRMTGVGTGVEREGDLAERSDPSARLAKEAEERSARVEDRPEPAIGSSLRHVFG